MEFSEMKYGTRVSDPVFQAYGVGVVQAVLKTRVKILFADKLITYDRAHVRFLSAEPPS